MRPGIELFVADPVVVIDLTAHIIKWLHRMICARITAGSGAVVNASHRAFATNQHFLTDLLINAKHVNFAQERIALLRCLLQLLLTGGINRKFRSNCRR